MTSSSLRMSVDTHTHTGTMSPLHPGQRCAPLFSAALLRHPRHRSLSQGNTHEAANEPACHAGKTEDKTKRCCGPLLSTGRQRGREPGTLKGQRVVHRTLEGFNSQHQRGRWTKHPACTVALSSCIGTQQGCSEHSLACSFTKCTSPRTVSQAWLEFARSAPSRRGMKIGPSRRLGRRYLLQTASRCTRAGTVSRTLTHAEAAYVAQWHAAPPSNPEPLHRGSRHLVWARPRHLQSVRRPKIDLAMGIACARPILYGEPKDCLLRPCGLDQLPEPGNLAGNPSTNFSTRTRGQGAQRPAASQKAPPLHPPKPSQSYMVPALRASHQCNDKI